MSLRSRVLPALYNGVSQQPPVLRASDQNEEELNTWTSLADGVGKRPPTETLANLGVISDDAFVHHINRDVTERFIVVIDGGTIKVFDHETGAAQTVNAPGGLSYLSSGKFRAVTIADYTFIVNTERTVELEAAGVDQLADPEFYRWLPRRPVGGILGSILNDEDFLRIAGSRNQYAPNPTNGAFAGEVASLEKLPETAANGTMYKVTGSVETGFISYYVRRNGAVWDETVANGLRNQLKATTLPHALVREADGTFTFAPFSWAPRRVGDDQTNPAPTFVGRTISDVFFYQNRLGLLCDENAILSAAGDFGNYFRSTVLDYVDSDVIDVAISTANVAILNYALPFNDGILLMADQTQFSLTNGEDGLTPSSVAIRPVTNYEVNVRVRPVTIGTEVYYCGDQNGYSIVWEYARLQDNEATTAAEITAHVPAYLPAGLRKLVAAGNLKALFALTGGADVFVYQFYWNGNEKLQSAWRKWSFGGPVIAGEFLGGYLYLLVRRADGVFLERVHLEAKARPAEQNHQTYLDRRCAVTGTYDPVAGRTTFFLPYKPDKAKFRMVRGKTHPTRPGSLMDPSQYQWPSDQMVSVLGNEPELSTGGEAYTMRFVFSRQFPVDYQGRAVTTGRLQLRTFTVYYSDTAFFRTEVAPYGAATVPDIEAIVPAKIADFTGKVVGDDDLRLNRPSYHTGSYSFQVYGDAAQATVALVNDTHVGSTFVSAEWEGFYFNRTSG